MLMELHDRGRVRDAVDAVFADVLERVELGHVAKGTQTAVWDPQSIAQARLREHDEWVRKQHEQVSAMAREIESQAVDEETKLAQLEQAGRELRTLKNSLGGSSLHDQELECEQHPIANMESKVRTRRVHNGLDPKAREQWAQAVQRAKVFKRERLEREERHRRREEARTQRLMKELEEAAKIRSASARVQQLENELHSIRQHKAFLERREERTRKLIMQARRPKVQAGQSLQPTAPPQQQQRNILTTHSSAADQGDHESTTVTTAVLQPVASGGRFLVIDPSDSSTPQLPEETRAYLVKRARMPLYKKMENDMKVRVELPRIRQHKQYLQERRVYSATPSRTEIIRHAEACDARKRAAKARAAARREELEKEWKKRSFPNSLTSVMRVTMEEEEQAKKARMEKLEQLRLQRQRQQEYGRAVRQWQRTRGGSGNNKDSEDVKTTKPVSNAQTSELGAAARATAKLRPPRTPPGRNDGRSRQRGAFEHRGRKIKEKNAPKDGPQQQAQQQPTRQRPPGQRQQQQPRSDLRLVNLQLESSRLEEEIKRREAHIMEKQGEAPDGQLSNDELHCAKVELSELYVSTIESKMKLLEAVIGSD